MKVKPAPGRAVRWPGTKRLLSSAGEDVPSTPYWLLLLRNRDIVAVTPAAAEVAPEMSAKAAPDVLPAPEPAEPSREQSADAAHDAVAAPDHAEETHG